MSHKNTSRTSTRETKQHKNSLLSSDDSIQFALKKKDYDFLNCKHYAKTPQSTLFFLSHSEVDQKRFVTPCTQGKGKSQRCTDASYNQNRKSQKVELLINSYDHHKMVTSRSRCGKKVKSNYKFSNIRTSIFVPNTKVKEKNKEDPKIELKIVRSPSKRIFRGYFDKYVLILWSFTIVFYCYKQVHAKFNYLHLLPA